jgi:hypothetical protein
MPCSKLEVPTVQHGTLSGAGYLHQSRYFSVQLIDYYTQNFDYIGTRTTGNGGGRYLLAGPNWKGEAPKGVDSVFRSETELAFPGYRTQLFNAADLDNVKKVQAGYKVQTLSEFLGQPAPKAAPAIDFVKPLTPAEQRTSPEFFNILNFVMQFCPTVPSETALMERFATIGIGAGRHLTLPSFRPRSRQLWNKAWRTPGPSTRPYRNESMRAKSAPASSSARGRS